MGFRSSSDLFGKNGIISADGKVGGVLSPPLATRLPAMQVELGPLVKEAERRHVLLRVGVLERDDDAVLVYAVDVGGPHDTHGFIRRLAAILGRYGAAPLDDDLDSHEVFELVNDLVSNVGRPNDG